MNALFQNKCNSVTLSACIHDTDAASGGSLYGRPLFIAREPLNFKGEMQNKHIIFVYID